LLRKGKYNHIRAPSQPKRDAAETLAIQALAFIAEEPEPLAHLLNMTGIAAEDIHAVAGYRAF
jgi:hypothetical protein